MCITYKSIILIVLLFVLPLNLHAKSDWFAEDIRWSFNALPDKIDNVDYRSLDRWYILTHLFETIVIFDLDQNVTSGVAESWVVSSDRLSYKFKIRSNARFSNGRAIRSQDVLFSLKRYFLNQKNDTVFKRAVKGVEYLEGIDAKIDGLVSINDREFIIRLNYPLENIWSFLAQPQIGGVVARESIDPDNFEMNAGFASSGPYYISGKTDQRIVLTSNQYHHSYDHNMPKTIGFYKQAGVLEAIEWFKTGKTNFYSLLDPFQSIGINYLKNKKFIQYPLHRVGFLYLNSNNQYLKKVDLRNKIASKLSSEYFHTIKNELVSWDNNFFPPGSPGYISGNNTFNIKTTYQAKNEIRLNVLVESGLENSTFLNLVAQRLIEADIKVDYTYLDKHEISQRFSKGEFDMGIISLGLPMSDHSFASYVYFVEEPAYLADPTGRIKDLFYQIIKTSDALQKKFLLQEISKQIRQDAVVLPLYHTAVRYYMQDDVCVNNNRDSKVDIELGSLRAKKVVPQ